MLLGAFVDFVPAEWLAFRGRIKLTFVFIGLCLTILLYGLLILGGRMMRLHRREKLRLWLALPFAPLFLGCACWLVLGKALPWSFTRILGSDQSIQTLMQTEHTSSRRSCDYQLTGGLLENTMPAHLCISVRIYDTYPDSEVQVRLVGRRSIFGFAVVSVFVGPPLQQDSSIK